MALRNNFLSQKISLSNTSFARILFAIIIGVGYTFIFYFLLCLTRASFRIFSILVREELWILDNESVFFFNFVFAFIAFTFGQSVAISMLIERPKNVFTKRQRHNISIINDQRNLLWISLSWLGRIGSIYAVFFVWTFSGNCPEFNLYPQYVYFFVLFITVLFLNSWITIRRVFKRNSFKWMLLAMLITILGSAGIAMINIVDYESVNAILQKNNIYYTRSLSYPESEFFEWNSGHNQEHIYVVNPLPHEGSQPVLLIDEKIVKIDELENVLHQWELDWEDSNFGRTWDMHNSKVYLHIDVSIKMEFVNDIQEILRQSNRAKVGYAVAPKVYNCHDGLYRNVSLPFILMNYYEDFIRAQYVEELNKELQLRITHSDSSKIYLNNNVVNSTDLKVELKSFMLTNPNAPIFYYTNHEISYSTYINVLSNAITAHKEILMEASMIKYSKSYNLLNREERRAIRIKHPFYVIEITPALLELENQL